MNMYPMRLLAATVAVTVVASALALEQDTPQHKPGDKAGTTLAEDGRIGKVTDVQGTVAVKPVMQRRWTPVAGSTILQPGDWLRTDARGANAVAVRLVKGVRLALGPGTLAELATPQQIRLHSGTIKIMASEKAPVELQGPQGPPVQVALTAIYRVDRPDGQYTIFGEVLSGMDVLEQLTPRNTQLGVETPPGDKLLSVEIEEK